MQDTNVFLSKGAHPKGSGDHCLMELVAYLAGEPHSDSPACTSPVLGEFGRHFNDALEDGPRQRLKLYASRMIGTAGDGLDEWRAQECLAWLEGTYLPGALVLSPLSKPQAVMSFQYMLNVWRTGNQAYVGAQAGWNAGFASHPVLVESGFGLLDRLLPGVRLDVPAHELAVMA